MAHTEQLLPPPSVSSRHLSVEVRGGETLRITRLSRADREENLLGTFPDVSWPTPWGTYEFIGGHRLWLAPESFPEVAEPEGFVEVILVAPNHIRLEQQALSPSGLVRTVEIELDESAPTMMVRHRLTNRGSERTEVAPWGLTMLGLGGTVTVRDGESATHDFTPVRRLVGWPYTNWSDPRLAIGSDRITWRALPGARWKLGIYAPEGSISYETDDFRLEKSIVPPEIAGTWPDLGCNFEVYSDERFLEIETLGHLTTLDPDQHVDHVEIWSVTTR